MQFASKLNMNVRRAAFPSVSQGPAGTYVVALAAWKISSKPDFMSFPLIQGTQRAFDLKVLSTRQQKQKSTLSWILTCRSLQASIRKLLYSLAICSRPDA